MRVVGHVRALSVLGGMVALSCTGPASPTMDGSAAPAAAAVSPVAPGTGGGASRLNAPPVVDPRTTPPAQAGSPHPVIAGRPPLQVKINLCRSSDPDPGDSLRYDVVWGDGTETGPGRPGAGTSLEDGVTTGCEGENCCRHRRLFEQRGIYTVEAQVSDKHLEDQGRDVERLARTVVRYTVDTYSDRGPQGGGLPTDCGVFFSGGFTECLTGNRLSEDAGNDGSFESEWLMIPGTANGDDGNCPAGTNWVADVGLYATQEPAFHAFLTSHGFGDFDNFCFIL
jgi:hypothetical protein